MTFQSSLPRDPNDPFDPSANPVRKEDADRTERFSNVPHSSEGFRTLPQDAESFGNIPDASESFGNVPHSSEAFRNEPHTSARIPDDGRALQNNRAGSHAQAETNISVPSHAAHETPQHQQQPPLQFARREREESWIDSDARRRTSERESVNSMRHDQPSFSETIHADAHASEHFRSRTVVPGTSARTENHTLTVKEVASMFEVAGVARTERSITNWCQPNRSGVARLDAYFDPNERRYFITPQSVNAAIEEEKAKAGKFGNMPIGTAARVTDEVARWNHEEDLPRLPKRGNDRPENKYGRDGQRRREGDGDASEHEKRIKELELEVFDLKIANRGKDYFIDVLQGEREKFHQEREGYVNKLIGFSRKVGELSTRLLQLGSPEQPSGTTSGDVSAHDEQERRRQGLGNETSDEGVTFG
jgi:hypothetical protein